MESSVVDIGEGWGNSVRTARAPTNSSGIVLVDGEHKAEEVEEIGQERKRVGWMS